MTNSGDRRVLSSPGGPGILGGSPGGFGGL